MFNDLDIRPIMAMAFLCFVRAVIFILVTGILGYFSIKLFNSNDYFFSAICGALFIKFLIKKE